MINERIRQLIENECKGNKRAFAKRLGISPSSIENVVGTRGSKPSFDLLEKILFSFENTDANWLILGVERSGTSKKKETDISNPDFSLKMLDEIKILNAKIADQAEMIGSLKAENNYLKKEISSVFKGGAEDAKCADAG